MHDATAVSPVFFAVILFVMFGVVCLPVFAAIDAAPTSAPKRLRTLDGLRGLLAPGVFLTHSALYHTYIATDEWASGSHFFSMCGGVSVSLFFMITGYLFWQKVLKEDGRPNWIGLYVGRIFRIGPLYLLMLALMVPLVFAKTGWHLNGTLLGFAHRLEFWLPLGYTGGGPDLNGLPDTWRLTAGVTWTLRYEWLFYAALLPLSLLARGKLASPLVPCVGFVAMIAVYALWGQPGAIAPSALCAALFLAGMSTAALQHTAWLPQLPPHVASAMVVGLVTLVILACPSPYSAPAAVALAGVFLLIASGSDVFGLLSTRGALRLGEVSYGIYLLHGLVLAAVFSVTPVKHFALASTGQFWTTIAASAALLVGLTTASLLLVERPGIALGRHVGKGARRLVERAARLSFSRKREKVGFASAKAG